MIDGALARRWHAESEDGELLDSLCDFVLTIGGLAAVVSAAAWPAWIIVALFMLWLIDRFVKKETLHGPAVFARIILRPVVNLAILSALGTTFMQWTWHISAGNASGIVALVAACVAVAKKERIAEYVRQAVIKSRG